MGVSINSGGLEWDATFNIDDLLKQVAKIEATLQNLSDKSIEATKDIENYVKKAAAAVASYVSLRGGTDLIREIIRVRGEFQQLEVAFETMLGNKEKADKLMQQVVNLAAQTPFSLQEAATGTKQLLAYGFSASNVVDNLRMLGDVAAGVGAPLNDIAFVYGTLKVQGRAYAEDIRQFTARGIPIIQLLAKQFHVTEEEVSKLISAGKVGFPEVEKAFKSLTSAGGMFFNLMEKQSKTLTGQISNLEDSWDRMLNSIGQANEGMIHDVIAGLTELVENYQTILDILEVLVATYGAYKAAVIATTIVQAIQTEAVKGYTIAEMLRYRAMLFSEAAMNLLNKTMLSNPVVAITTGFVALATTLAIFGKRTSEAKSASDLLANSQDEVNKKMAAAISKVQPYVEALKKANLTESERESIYKNLQKIDSKLVEGLDAKTLSYEKLSDQVNVYLEALRKQYRLEANQKAIQESIQIETDLKTRYDKLLKLQDNYNKKAAILKARGDKEGAGIAQFSSVEAGTDAKAILADLEAQKKVTKELGETQVEEETKVAEVKKRTLDVIEAEIKAEKDRQSATSTNSKEYNEIQKRIDALQAEADAITGNRKKQQKIEDELNAILKKRIDLIDRIAAFERDAAQSGMLKQEREVDVINEKYEEQLKLLAETNKQIEKYNKSHPKTQQTLLGGDEVARLTTAKNTLVSNALYKEDAEKYIELAKQKQAAFEEFKAAEETGNEELIGKARELYAAQIGEFDNYLAYLQKEAAAILPKVILGTANIGDLTKLQGVTALFTEAQSKQVAEYQKKQLSEFKNLLEATQAYNVARGALDRKYNVLYSTLEKERTKITEDEYKSRKAMLEDQKDEELETITKTELGKQSVYKKFENGFQNLGTNALKGIIAGLEKLKKQFEGNIQAIKLINKAIGDAKVALDTKTGENFQEVIGVLQNTMKDFSIKFSDNFKIDVSQILNAVKNIQTLFDSSSSTTEQVGSIIALVNFVIISVRDALLTAEDMADPLQEQKDYYEGIKNEIAAANDLLARQKLLIDDLVGNKRLGSTLDYMEALKKKEQDSLQAIKNLQIDLIKSQKEVYVDPVFGTEVSTGGFLGFYTDLVTGGQAVKKIKYELEAIDTSGLNTIEDFANLLAEIKKNGGKLDGKVVLEEDIKALEELINSYDEAIAQQKELKKELDQLFTGTTADAIADSIIQGFKQGKRGAEDFADDFEQMMIGAVLNSLKYQTLEEPLADFYEKFSQASGADGVLTSDEIAELKRIYDDIINKAAEQFDNLQKITNLDLTSGGSGDTNSLSGAIKGMTEQQAELLAGQFGGLRVTAIDQLKMATQHLSVLQEISYNTATLHDVKSMLRDFQLNGIKVK